jgi:hypothetical protein
MWGKRSSDNFNVDRIDLEQLANVIRESGYKALVEQDSAGISYIESANHGWKTSVYMHSDSNNAFQFQLWLRNEDPKIGLDAANKFNLEYRIGKALLTTNGDGICLQMDVDLEGGVSQLYIAKRVAAWDLIVGIFRDAMAKAVDAAAPTPSR